jgi:DNA-binding GntR family transcriptional regulator
LSRAIVAQALVPDTKLVEETICRKLGVTRHSVRVAFQMLARDKLVDIRQNKGATIAKPSAEHGKDVLRIRMELEDIALRLIQMPLNDRIVKEMYKLIEAEKKSFEKDVGLYMEQACSFHRFLAKLSSSDILFKYIDPLLSQSSLVLYLYGRPKWSLCNSDEHLDVVRALEVGNTNKAREVMRAHLCALYDRAFSGEVLEKVDSLEDILTMYSK